MHCTVLGLWLLLGLIGVLGTRVTVLAARGRDRVAFSGGCGDSVADCAGAAVCGQSAR